MAVLEKGFSPEERSTYTTLATAVVDAAAAGCASPAVTVIGPVVHALADGARPGSGVPASEMPTSDAPVSAASNGDTPDAGTPDPGREARS